MDTVKLSQILPDENQPRKFFDASKLKVLKDSIKKQGIISPLIVQEIGAGKYLLIDGERRYRAAQELDMKEVPVVIEKPTSATERRIRQFEVQEQHEAWSPIEKAQAILDLSTDLKLSLIDTCILLNVPDDSRRRYTAFANLADKEHFVRSEIPLFFAQVLQSITNEAKRLSFSVLKKEFTVSDAKALEHRISKSIRDGAIVNRVQAVRLKDAFVKNPKLIEEYMHNPKATPDSLYLSSGATSSNALRNVIFNAQYIGNHVKRFEDAGADIALSIEQVDILKRAEFAIKKMLAHVA